MLGLMLVQDKGSKDGPIVKPDLKDIKKEPYALPAGFEWSTIDLTNED